MQYAQVVQIAARAAVETIAEVFYWDASDALKVWQILTCRQALQTYRSLFRLFQIACMIAVLLGMKTREWSDAFVASCEAPAAPVAVSAPDARRPTPDAPAAPETLALPAPPQPVALLVAAPAPIALLPAAAPAPAPSEPAWRSLKGEARKRALRAACTAAGIQWRWKEGKGQKFLTIAQMEAALS